MPDERPSKAMVLHQLRLHRADQRSDRVGSDDSAHRTGEVDGCGVRSAWTERIGMEPAAPEVVEVSEQVDTQEHVNLCASRGSERQAQRPVCQAVEQHGIVIGRLQAVLFRRAQFVDGGESCSRELRPVVPDQGGRWRTIEPGQLRHVAAEVGPPCPSMLRGRQERPEGGNGTILSAGGARPHQAEQENGRQAAEAGVVHPAGSGIMCARRRVTPPDEAGMKPS